MRNVITISRQYGSGGREIGEKLAEKLGIPLHDKSIVEQADVIREFSKKPCIIIGRAADSILEQEECITIFIKSDEENRVNRVMKRKNCSEKEARKVMHHTDKERSRFYQYYSDKKWGDAKNYDITIDSGRIGIDNTVKLILTYIKLLAESQEGNI